MGNPAEGGCKAIIHRIPVGSATSIRLKKWLFNVVKNCCFATDIMTLPVAVQTGFHPAF